MMDIAILRTGSQEAEARDLDMTGELARVLQL